MSAVPARGLREDALVLALLVEHGLAPADDALAWACAVVIAEDAPDAAVLEVAGLVRPHALDVVAALRRVPGEADEGRVFGRVCARLLGVVRSDPAGLRRVTEALEAMALAGEVPREHAGACAGLEDARLLAEQGVYGRLPDVAREVAAFLAEVAAG